MRTWEPQASQEQASLTAQCGHALLCKGLFFIRFFDLRVSLVSVLGALGCNPVGPLPLHRHPRPQPGPKPCCAPFRGIPESSCPWSPQRWDSASLLCPGGSPGPWTGSATQEEALLPTVSKWLGRTPPLFPKEWNTHLGRSDVSSGHQEAAEWFWTLFRCLLTGRGWVVQVVVG